MSIKFAVVLVAAAVLSVTGLCRADDQRKSEALSVEQVGADKPSGCHAAARALVLTRILLFDQFNSD